eukprot:7755768-Alexandrium_andersonii.AAC.1
MVAQPAHRRNPSCTARCQHVRTCTRSQRSKSTARGLVQGASASCCAVDPMTATKQAGERA